MKNPLDIGADDFSVYSIEDNALSRFEHDEPEDIEEVSQRPWFLRATAEASSLLEIADSI